MDYGGHCNEVRGVEAVTNEEGSGDCELIGGDVCEFWSFEVVTIGQ